mgnify:CR=1 FL=1
MARIKKQEHPLRSWMKLNSYKSVNALYLKLDSEKVCRDTIYKILYNQNVSDKRLTFLLGRMERKEILEAEESKKLGTRIRLWKAFPEYRENMKALKKLF